ncbi:MAG: aldehyde ferredoxin oxidoreductase C-terminal domain-containing protein, partial [Desulfovibrionales bacterium]|nr:aldehyde ferredoxin oxidoreductase C-terminal domain-containing protein [Desulfovibrionales bacterium]
LTGLSGSRENIQSIAKNVSDLVRAFNLREGMTPEDETLSKGLQKPLAQTGQTLTPQELQHMVKDYYRLRGWDENGHPQ